MRLTFFLLLLSIGLTAQDATGMVFEEKPFEELLAQAKTEDKIIFIDAYTTWCGPCKMMSAKIFPDESVGEVYNERFINAKFDMEKGEGPGLAQRYSVQAYPTYLFVNGDGELVHKGLGYIPIPAFLKLADVAVSDESLGAMNKRYASGDRDATFIKGYAEILNATYEKEKAEVVIGEYLDSQSDWSSEENLSLLVSSPGKVGDKRLIYLIEHADEVEEKVGASAITNTIQLALVVDYLEKKGAQQLLPPADLEKQYDKHAPKLKDRLLGNYKVMYYGRQNDMENYLPAAMEYYTAYPSEDFSELNSVAWTFFENAEDEKQLAQAVKWAEKSVELNAYYPNLDTLAWLYQKTGQREKAVATAKRAIEVAEEEGLDYSDTEKIFEQ